jgi:hypothetical protein
MNKKVIIIGIMLLSAIMFGCSSKSTQTIITTNSTNTAKTQSEDTSIDLYMKENNISLKAKDVQFDMKNNLDKDFVIEGIAKLSGYYNYGFKDEENYFCIKVNTDNTESNSWYLYCDRKSFSELFEIVKSKNAYITATCKISSNIYKSDQGNMAEVSNIKWMVGN